MEVLYKNSPMLQALYNQLVIWAKENPDKWHTHEEICEALPEHFSLNHKACKKMCCSNIQKSVLAINDSEEVEYIILYDKQTYKLAMNCEEVRKFLKTKFLKKNKNAWERYWKIKRKATLDGQVSLNLADDETEAFLGAHSSFPI